ncbi:MAG TPA: Bax inhibitor-1 family protein, partial [Kofleriaceae bacterium]
AYAQQQAAYQQQAEHAAYQQYYAQAQYAQQQQQQQPQPNALGSMASKLQERAEKQKQKLEKAMRKESKGGNREIAGADATVGQSARRRFIKKTYTHLFFAIVTFALLLFVFRTVEPFPTLLQPFVDFALGGRWNWGVVLAAYVGVSFICDRWASNAKSRKMQYLGLGFYVLAEAVIFVPLLAVVAWKTQDIVARGGGEPNIVRDAAFMTLGTFAFLTLSVLVSKKDFSFLRSGLFAASGAAMTLIVLSLMFGFNLGLVFSVGMVVLASGYILMQTSQILAHYDPESHVAASLALFSSIALMFWYMIRIVMRAKD